MSYNNTMYYIPPLTIILTKPIVTRKAVQKTRIQKCKSDYNFPVHRRERVPTVGAYLGVIVGMTPLTRSLPETSEET